MNGSLGGVPWKGRRKQCHVQPHVQWLTRNHVRDRNVNTDQHADHGSGGPGRQTVEQELFRVDASNPVRHQDREGVHATHETVRQTARFGKLWSFFHFRH